MTRRGDPFQREDPRRRTRRDVDRLRRREAGGRFWRSMGLIGSVGWPIVLLATGGALLGNALDRRFGTGIHFTLMLVTAGAALGSLVAYRTVRGRGP